MANQRATPRNNGKDLHVEAKAPPAPPSPDAPPIPQLDIDPNGPEAQALQQLLMQAIFWKQKYFELQQHSNQVIGMLSGQPMQQQGMFQPPQAGLVPQAPWGQPQENAPSAATTE